MARSLQKHLFCSCDRRVALSGVGLFLQSFGGSSSKTLGLCPELLAPGLILVVVLGAVDRGETVGQWVWPGLGAAQGFPPVEPSGKERDTSHRPEEQGVGRGKGFAGHGTCVDGISSDSSCAGWIADAFLSGQRCLTGSLTPEGGFIEELIL